MITAIRYTIILCITCLTLLTTNTSFAGDTSISIHKPVINPTVPGMPVTAAYMMIENHGKKSVKLVEVKGTVSDRIELHEHSMQDGLMKMQEVDSGITIEPKTKTVLKPGGYHIMIMNLTNSVEEGSSVELTLVFSDGTTTTVIAKATKPSTKAHSHSHSHSHPHSHHKHH